MGLCPKDHKLCHSDACTPMLIAVVFTIAGSIIGLGVPQQMNGQQKGDDMHNGTLFSYAHTKEK